MDELRCETRRRLSQQLISDHARIFLIAATTASRTKSHATRGGWDAFVLVLGLGVQPSDPRDEARATAGLTAIVMMPVVVPLAAAMLASTRRGRPSSVGRKGTLA